VSLLQIEAGAEEIAIFGAVSESFTKKNINCTVAQSNKIFHEVANAALEKGLRVRGYISCVCGCPYEGAVHPTAVAKVCYISKPIYAGHPESKDHKGKKNKAIHITGPEGP
jgi:isopropylmalate/homocitrate/citramalate synthase